MSRFEKSGKVPRVIELLILSDGRVEFYKGKADGSGRREAHKFKTVEEARAKGHELMGPSASKGYMYCTETTQILIPTAEVEPYFAPKNETVPESDKHTAPTYTSELERNCGEYDVTPSERYRNFIEKNEGGLVDGREMRVSTYRDPIQLHFSGEELDSFFKDDSETTHSGSYQVDFSRHPGWIPLATIGLEEEQFLCVEAAGQECAIAMWEHETESLVSILDSLDALLINLQKGPER